MSSAGRTVLRFCSLITPLTAAAVALAIFAVLLSAALSSLVLSFQPASAQVPVIAIVAFDLYPTGNTATSIGAGGAGIDAGDIQSTLDNVAIGSTVTFDIVVDAVPSPGLFAVGLEVHYDPTVVEVSAVDRDPGGLGRLLQYTSGATLPFGINDSLPHHDGPFRAVALALTATFETGPGKVLEVTVKCVATGTTPITLTDAFTGGGVNAGILGVDVGTGDGFAFTIGTELEAAVGCGVPVTDGDSDGVVDVLDSCPNDPEDFDGFEDADGCPDPDNDGDGVLDITDNCPIPNPD